MLSLDLSRRISRFVPWARASRRRPRTRRAACRQRRCVQWGHVLRRGTVVSILIFSSFFIPHTSFIIHAQSAPTVQEKIKERQADIQALEKEIAAYQSEINTLGSQASSLASTIRSLELTQKKLEADIKVTENKIASKNLEIQQLGSQISEKQETIADDRRIISYSLSLINQDGTRSLPEMLLGSRSLSEAWNNMDELGAVQGNLIGRVDELRQAKANLEANKRATEKAKAELVKLSRQLSDQKKITVATAAETNQLLKETKNNQASYSRLLAERQRQKEAFEREILQYESQLKTVVDTSRLPTTGSGVLSWPVDKVFVTQYFGDTSFASANPQLYKGKGHNGIDLRASVGTPIKAALSGVISGVGNTDLVRGCLSYGKWVVVKHPNGLSTIYAHLSLQSVSVGQEVSSGQIIAYSGKTGAVTGPHLHFGVFATQGVEIGKLTRSQSTYCAGAVIPLAPLKAYLNPLSYL